MRLVFHINFYIIFLISFCGFSQDRDTSIFTIDSKYKAEYSPYFKFNTFNRGGTKQLLVIKLDALSAKDKDKWTFQDSFSFAQTNLLIGNIDLGIHYFQNLNLDPDVNKSENTHYLAALYLNKEYKAGSEKLKEDYMRILQFSDLYFLKHIFNCQDSLINNDHWYKSNGNVCNFKIDTLLKDINKKDDRFKDEVLNPINNASHTLDILVTYVHEDDPIIACAFNNVGEVLEEYVSLSQAYIAYSIGRNYNKKDKQILENIKSVKAKLTAKNYKIPNFRKYFPKIQNGRFDYEILKEKIIQGQNDTIVKHKPILLDKKEKIEIPFPIDAIIPIGLSAVFLLILLFVRSKRK